MSQSFAKTIATTAAIRPERPECAVGTMRDQANHPTVTRGHGMR